MTAGKDRSDEPAEHREPGEGNPAERAEPGDKPTDPHGESAEHHAAETVAHAARSEDRPMERKAPQAPFALVGLSYLGVLALVGLIIGIVLFWLSR